MVLALAALVVLGPCDAPEARAFDFWVGEWNVNNRYRTPGGWVDAGSATNQVFPVLGGCAVVELWDGNLGQNRIRGFSIRAWSAAERQWVLVLNWPQANAARFGVLRGDFRHGRGDFHVTRINADGDSVRTRYTFSDITDTSLRWNDGTSTDGGTTWRTNWIMEFTRRDPVRDPPLRNVPLADPGRIRLCEGDVYRTFDQYLGQWAGAPSDSSVRNARLESIAIVGECAILDQLAWDDDSGHHEAVLVRSWLADPGEWRQWALDTDHREFVMQRGAGPDLVSDDGAQRMRWWRDGDSVVLSWDRPGGPVRFVLARRR